MLQNVQFSKERDELPWRWDKVVCFFSTLKLQVSFFQHTQVTGMDPIWKGKLSHKIKAFTWLVYNNMILTKVNLQKRGWKGNHACSYCS